VEPTLVVASPGAETHIDAIAAEGGYLHTSPEFAMKRLLAAGEQKLCYFGKCWRKGETSPLHAPEFTMVEWYRANESYDVTMADCVALLRVASEAVDAKNLRWRDLECDPFADPAVWKVNGAFRYFANLDVLDTLHADGSPNRDALARAINDSPDFQDRVGPIHAELLTEYPVPEAALAQRTQHDARVAERFELYACGVELANGFGELNDPVEQRARLIEAMDEKQRRYGKSWPIDEDFLAALAHMPPASGVALGFDRLVMLATGARHINDVLWTPYG
jgi:lysyl-tRNA synthetase class 2